MELTVEAILPDDNRSGIVNFKFSGGPDKDLVIEMPYADATSIDDGVKQAAALLAQFAERLAEQARELAEPKLM